MVQNPNHILATICVAMCVFATDFAMATPVGDKYAQLGGAKGFLGAPTTAEAPTPDGVGRYRHFAGGSIYWHPSAGAHEVHGLIRGHWAALGYERSYLGYPTSDEMDSFDSGGRVSKFQGGELIWREANNKVSEVRSTDLTIDLPFPAGQPWYVIQSNGVTNSDSHLGPWAYCWDFMLAGPPQSASNGKLFVAAADGPIVYVDEGNDSKGLSGL